MKIEYLRIKTRDDRAHYIAERFAKFLTGKVLDVGSDTCRLKPLLKGADYQGVDVGGNPDLVIDLEKQRLPFPDGTFDCVVCSDVLEHLDGLHSVFDDLVRVSRRYVIVSLPNNWANARKPIGRGRGSVGHYGLPVDPPVDRHKWFFSMSEAESFVKGRSQLNNASVEEIFCLEKPRSVFVRAIRRLYYPHLAEYLNCYGHSLWAIIKVAS